MLGGPKKDGHSVGWLGTPGEAGTQQDQFHEWEQPRAMNIEEKSSEHFRWTHLEQLQHCTDLPHQVTFPVHTE